MSDLEPASALAHAILDTCADDEPTRDEHAGLFFQHRYSKAEQLIESDRAAVREPLERRNRELETLVCDEREVILQQRERIASLEAQLASVREGALRDLVDAAEALVSWDWPRLLIDGLDSEVAANDAALLEQRLPAAKRALEALLTSPPKSPWIPVSERKPERGQICQVVCKGVVQHVVYMWRGAFWQPCVDEFDSADADEFSHWAPQLPPPAAQKEPL